MIREQDYTLLLDHLIKARGQHRSTLSPLICNFVRRVSVPWTKFAWECYLRSPRGLLAFVFELNCLLCTYCTLIPFRTLCWVSRFNSGTQEGGVAFSELLWVLLTMETDRLFQLTGVKLHSNPWICMQQIVGYLRRNVSSLWLSSEKFFANAGWNLIIPHFFLHFYSPAPRSRFLFHSHLFGSRICGKLSTSSSQYRPATILTCGFSFVW